MKLTCEFKKVKQRFLKIIAIAAYVIKGKGYYFEF
jgi:hypothetical protein